MEWQIFLWPLERAYPVLDVYNGYLQIAELDAASITETSLPVLRKTYLWDPMEPIATRILAMTVFDETGIYVEDYTMRTICSKTRRPYSTFRREDGPCMNTARMVIFLRWKGMRPRTIHLGSQASMPMTNLGWFTTITVIMIPKMAGGLVETR